MFILCSPLTATCRYCVGFYSWAICLALYLLHVFLLLPCWHGVRLPFGFFLLFGFALEWGVVHVVASFYYQKGDYKERKRPTYMDYKRGRPFLLHLHLSHPPKLRLYGDGRLLP